MTANTVQLPRAFLARLMAAVETPDDLTDAERAELLEDAAGFYGGSGRNYYGEPIVPPELFDGEHTANPMGAGLPPVCSCGWTRHQSETGDWYELADHLRDMREAVAR